MIPFDAVRNPFLQFQWLPCKNVGSTVIQPYSLVVVTGVSNAIDDGAQSGTVTDYLQAVLEVVDATEIDTLSRFDFNMLAFSGPTTIGINSQSLYCSYGSCNTGNVGLLRYYDSRSDSNPWWITSAPPCLLSPIGDTGGVDYLHTLQLTRIIRDRAHEIGFQDCSASFAGGSGHLNLSGGVGVNTGSWLFTVSNSVVTPKFSGSYEVGFSAQCDFASNQGATLSAGVQVNPVLYTLGNYIRAKVTVRANTTSSLPGYELYDSPHMSARGILDCNAGQGIYLQSFDGSAYAVTLRYLNFYVRYLWGV